MFVFIKIVCKLFCGCGCTSSLDGFFVMNYPFCTAKNMSIVTYIWCLVITSETSRVEIFIVMREYGGVCIYMLYLVI